MASVIETIKAKLDVVEEIGAVVVLQKSGKALKGLCPFHNERTPSFYVFAESQTWHCFGCHEGGDIFSFAQKYQSLEFHDALLYLAEKAGVTVEDDNRSAEESQQARETSAARERLRKLNEDALLWFHQMLLRSKDASEARVYVQSRGISSETVVAFSLGYAPNSWDGLSRYLLAQGYTERELVSGGLARMREPGEDGSGGGLYDYFRNRLIFPIRDNRGRVIGFGGRALGDGSPKYLNSPQTLLFEKNTVLYAMDMAKDAIKSAGQVVIVEGYVDAIIAHQYGTKQTVACIGSAITEKHIAQLKKLTRQVTLALDPDAAGASATEHGIQEALKGFDSVMVPVPLAASDSGRRNGSSNNRRSEPRGMIRLEEQVDAEINVLQLPPGEDPDEFIRRDYPAWFYAVSHPLPLVDYYFVAKTAGLELKQPNGQAEAARRLLPVIAMMSDRIKRDAYIRKLSMMISIDERSLYDGLQRVLRGQHSTGITAEFTDKSGRRNSNSFAQGSEALLQRGNRETPAGSKPGWIETHGEDEPDSAAGSTRQEKQHSPTAALDRQGGSRVKLEDYLIGLLLQNPGLSQRVYGIINDGDFSGTDTRELYHILNSVYSRGSSSTNQPVEELVPAALLETVARARRSVVLGVVRDGAWQNKEAVQCAARLKRASLLQQIMEVRFLLRDAERTADEAAIQLFEQRVSVLRQELHTISSAVPLQG